MPRAVGTQRAGPLLGANSANRFEDEKRYAAQCVRMKLESYHSTEDKKHWKLVRTDSYEDVEGEIVTADEDTGECAISVPDGNGGTQTKTLSFGPLGIKLVGRKR